MCCGSALPYYPFLCYYSVMYETLNELGKRFPAAPEYLMQIYVINRDYGHVNNARLAERLKVSRSAVTQAVGRLRKLEMAEQDRYGVIELTKQGNELARQVLRRHYLIEHLLVNILDYPWDLADDEAARLQDKISADLEQHLFERLGQPRSCPHGNPFPGTEEEAAIGSTPSLDQAEAGDEITVLRITEEGEQYTGILAFCFRESLQPGTRWRVEGSRKGFLILRQSGGDTEQGQRPAMEMPREYAPYIRISR